MSHNETKRHGFSFPHTEKKKNTTTQFKTNPQLQSI